MGQSLLIDMNSGWYKHKTEVNDGLKTRNYDQVLGALDSLNALLPPEYRVIIDDDDYNDKLKGNLIGLCNFCESEYNDPTNKNKILKGPTQIEHSKIKKLRLLLPETERLIYNKKYDDFWCCFKCSNMNRLSETKFRQTILKKPFYLQVVPEAPRRKLGIEDRTSYHVKFAKWARNFLAELNASAQKFRQEYKPKDDEVDEQGIPIEDDDIFD